MKNSARVQNQRRELRLRWQTIKARWEDYWKRLADYYIRKSCPHHWRAVVIRDMTGPSPGKVCRICETYQKLTIEEYYAEFGEIGMAAIHLATR